MKIRYSNIIILIFATLIILLALYFNTQCKNNNSYSINQINGEYKINIYNHKGKKVFTESYPIEPSIIELNEDIIEIVLSTGSPSRNVFFFNRENLMISKVFFDPIVLDNKYVAYMENNELFLTDIFGQGLLNKKINRDFTQTANPISAIISIEMINNETIKLSYYKGEDYNEQTEIINLKG